MILPFASPYICNQTKTHKKGKRRRGKIRTAGVGEGGRERGAASRRAHGRAGHHARLGHDTAAPLAATLSGARAACPGGQKRCRHALLLLRCSATLEPGEGGDTGDADAGVAATQPRGWWPVRGLRGDVVVEALLALSSHTCAALLALSDQAGDGCDTGDHAAGLGRHVSQHRVRVRSPKTQCTQSH